MTFCPNKCGVYRNKLKNLSAIDIHDRMYIQDTLFKLDPGGYNSIFLLADVSIHINILGRNAIS